MALKSPVPFHGDKWLHSKQAPGSELPILGRTQCGCLAGYGGTLGFGAEMRKSLSLRPSWPILCSVSSGHSEIHSPNKHNKKWLLRAR